jgi:hypothetical protein
MLVDTTKPSSTAPLQVTYLSDVENQVAAVRVDREGIAYIAGTTASLEFPHDAVLTLTEKASPSPEVSFGFVSALKQPGLGVLWSTLLPNSHLTALALDGGGTVFVTGRVVSRSSGGSASPKGDVLVAELSDHGRRLSYTASFGGAANQEGRAISTSSLGNWVFVTGVTDSSNFLKSSLAKARAGEESFVVALQPCVTGVLYSGLLTEMDTRFAPGIALTPALDAFSAYSSERFSAGAERKVAEAARPLPGPPACPGPAI